MVAKNAEDRGIERVVPGLYQLLFDRDGLEAETAGHVFKRFGRKMIDVFGIKFLKGRVEIIVVTAGIRRFQIKIASWPEDAPGSREKSGDVVNVFEDVAEDDTVEGGQVSGSRGDRPGIGLKASLAASIRAPRRGIEASDGGESLTSESGEEAAGGTAGIEYADGARWRDGSADRAGVGR